MAQRRMLSKSISVSERIANLSERAQVLVTWSIAHADDFGLLPKSEKKIKAMIVPFWDITLQSVTDCIGEIIAQSLWVLITFKNSQYYCFPKWFDHQDLRRDIKPKLYAGDGYSWEDYMDVRSELLRICPDSLPKLSEVKLSEVKGSAVRSVPRRPHPHKNKFEEVTVDVSV